MYPAKIVDSGQCEVNPADEFYGRSWIVSNMKRRRPVEDVHKGGNLNSYCTHLLREPRSRCGQNSRAQRHSGKGCPSGKR